MMSERNVLWSVVERWIRNGPHTCWTISAIVSYVHLKIFRCLQRDSNPWPLRCLWRSICWVHMFPRKGRHKKFSQVLIWDNRWDCPTSVRIISSIHLSTTRHKTFLSRNIKCLNLFANADNGFGMLLLICTLSFNLVWTLAKNYGRLPVLFVIGLRSGA